MIFVCICLVTYFACNRKYTDQELVGTYVNNFNELAPPYFFSSLTPRMSDTLILLENGGFTSNFFGEGSYKTFKQNGFLLIDLKYVEINHKMDTIIASIRFDIPYKEVKVGYQMTVKSKGLFGRTPILVLDFDSDYYYKKIK